MRNIVSCLAAAAAISIASPADAQDAAGRWAVAGIVDGKTFTLDCKFQQSDQVLSGACVDGPTGDATVQGGRSHPLLDGQISGQSIHWTYESSYLFIKFDVKYAGTVRDDHMSGTIAAAGKAGTFTADRAKP